MRVINTNLVSHCNTVSTLSGCVSSQLAGHAGLFKESMSPCHTQSTHCHGRMAGSRHVDMSIHCLLFLLLFLLFKVAKRKAIESALSSQFYLLIQQFAVNSEKVARILYGISVINIDDLEIATIHALTEIERATVLAITLVRRLRRWPDLFGDVCKVLGDIPSMQEANGTHLAVFAFKLAIINHLIS